MRLWLALPLLLLPLAGCFAPADPLPMWGDESPPDWVVGEQWRYRIDENATLNVTVIAVDEPLHGLNTLVSDWAWRGIFGGYRNATWRVWQDPASLAWVHLAVIHPDGTLATEQDLSACPVMAIFPGGNSTFDCREEYAGMGIDSNVYRTDHGWSRMATPLGELRVHAFDYRSDFGDPTNGKYSPAIGNWAYFEMNIPKDVHHHGLRPHALESYYNPRTDTTSP